MKPIEPLPGDASSNWTGGQNDQFDDKADACESYADELEGWDFSGESSEQAIRDAAADDGSDPDDAWDEALQEMRDEAISTLESFENPG